MDESQRPRHAAVRALERLGARHDAGAAAQVDVDQLARELGLDVETFHPATRRSGTLGWLEPGEPLIFLSEGLAESSRRFTLAHEIGHFVLHRGEHGEAMGEESEDAPAECDVGDLDAPVDDLSLASETLRPGQAYSARARRESEANQFASYLLLPAGPLLAAYRGLRAGKRQTTSTTSLRSLADRFGVSEDVLLRRLTALLVQAPLELSEDAAAAPTLSRAVPMLDPDQRAAAHSSTPALVIAGPGTGKTSTLVARVAYLVGNEGIPAESILALTFSNKAAGEMRERIRTLLAPPGDDDDDTSAQARLPQISTIHAFCGDLLRRYAPLVGLRPDYRLVTDAEGYFLLREISSTLDVPHYIPLASPAQHFPALLSAISRAKDELCDPEGYLAAARTMVEQATTPEEHEAAEKALEVARAYAAYQAALGARGDADYGDLIMLTVRLLREQPEVRAQLRALHRHILVDEFQDINRAMGVLLNTLAGADGALWAVGDADQAIYRFRGASPANLAQFTTDYPAASVHTLRRNYRSLTPVLECAAGIARVFLEEGERPALVADRDGEQARIVTLATAENEDAELAGIAELIRRRLADDRRLSDQVVLCRTRRQCQRIAGALAANDIPTLLPASLFDQDDVKDLLAIAGLLADTSGASLLRLGRSGRHGFTHRDADIVLMEARARQVLIPQLLSGPLNQDVEISADGRSGLACLGQSLAELRRAPDVATGLARYVFAHSEIGAALLTFDDHGEEGERRESAGRIAQILALARAYDDQRRGARRFTTGGDWTGFLDFLRVVAALRQENGSGSPELAMEDGVRVMTVHASKGLEFPIVYLPGLADRRFPMQRQWEPAPLPAPLRDGGGLADPREVHLAEEACLFYVALTRARDELILSHAERYGNMRYQPSPFLTPIRDALGPDLRVMKWSVPKTAGQPATPSTKRDTRERATSERGRPEGDTQPLTISALETYARCPKQYAYRYVHGLRPREIGLSTLRRSLHITLNDLHARYTEQRQSGADTPSLEEALALFDGAWRGAVRGENSLEAVPISSNGAPTSHEADALAGPDRPDGPFDDVYRRHGRDIVTRVWSSLVIPAGSDPARQASDNDQAFDQTVVVHVGERDIAVKLDRVEVPSTRGRVRRGARSTAGQTRDLLAEPARVVRHKLGVSQDRSPDLRALLYRLAAEQTPGGRPNLYQQNLTTGEVQPLEIDQRRLAKLRDDLDELITGIERADFAPRPSPNTCNACPFLFVCPT